MKTNYLILLPIIIILLDNICVDAKTIKPAQTAKSTAVIERLISSYQGLRTTTGDIRNSDSSSYLYSGNRGGDLNGTIKPDTIIHYTWDSSFHTWKPSYQFIYSYDAHNNITQLVYQLPGNGGWITTGRSRYTYDAAGREITATRDTFSKSTGAFLPFYQDVSTYDPGGYILTINRLYWSAVRMSFSAPYSRSTWTYNSASKVLSELMEYYNGGTSAWVNSFRYLYTYDGANNMSTFTYHQWNTSAGSWQNSSRELYYYDASNHQTGIVSQGGNGSSWRNYDSTYNSYDAAGNNIFSMRYFDNFGTWVPFSRGTFTYSVTGKVETALTESYYASTGNWENRMRYYYFYNSYDHLTREYGQEWDGSNWVTYYENRFYYETYNNDTGIPNNGQPVAIHLFLYPVPAGSVLNVNIQFASLQTFTGTITDATGKVVYQWNDEGNGLYLHNINTGILASGVYYLSVRSNTEVVTQRFSVRH